MKNLFHQIRHSSVLRLAELALALGVVLFAALAPKTFAAAGIYRPINYQGKLSSTGGVAIANGQYNMRFKIFDVSTGGVAKWTETWSNSTQRVTSTGGLFSIALGSITTMTGSVDFNSDSLYLQVEFDPGNDGTYEEIFSPRRRFASVPYAHNANTLDGLDSTQFLRSDTDATASGTITVRTRSAAKIGIDIISNGGSTATGALRLSTAGGPAIIFGSGGLSYDTNLYRSSPNTLKTDDALQVVGTLSGSRLIVSNNANISGALLVRNNITTLGTLSGYNLTVSRSASISGTLIVKTGITSKGSLSGSTFYGAGLGDCTGATQKLLYNPSTGKFTCGTISASSSFSTGNVLTIGDARYVKKSGDTMTGTLVLNPQSGLALNARGTISGSLITQNGAGNNYFMGNLGIGTASPATKLHVSSNTAGEVVRFVGSNTSFPIIFKPLQGEILQNGDFEMIIDADNNSTTNAFMISKDASHESGSPVELFRVQENGTVGIGTTAPKAQLDVVGTISGSRLSISNFANISGALLVKGVMSGRNLTLSNSASISGTLIVKTGITSKGSLSGSTFYGAGLGDCTGATQKLLYNPSTGKFTCGTISTASTFSTGNVLTIGDARYLRKSGGTMTGQLVVNITNGNVNTVGLKVINTLSGAIIHAEKTLTSSGNLVVSGTVSHPIVRVSNSGADTAIAFQLRNAGVTNNVEYATTVGVSGTEANDSSNGGGVSWTSLSNVHTSDNTYAAAATLYGFETSTYLKATNFGFAIPSNAIIDGIVVKVERSKNLSDTITDSAVRLVKGGVIGSTDKSSSDGWPIGTDGVIEYGGSNDLWGTTWSPSDINASNFGFAIAAQNNCGFMCFGADPRIDYIEILVHYHTFGTVSDPVDWTLGIDKSDGAKFKLSHTDALGLGDLITATLSGTVGLGTTNPKAKLDVVGTLSGSRLVVSGHANISGTLLVLNGITSKATVSGANLFAAKSITGTHLYAAQTFNGAGLADCDTAGTSKLLWDSTTKRFSCGTDRTGAFSTGNVLTIGDARYLKRSGGTMTGQLVVNITNGNINTIGLNILNTLSGAIVHGERAVTSSGILLVTQSTAWGSGALVVRQRTNSTGAFITNAGRSVPTLVLENSSGSFEGASKAQHILFGYQGDFDVALFRSTGAVLNLSGHLLPSITNKFDLGSSARRWRDLYLSGGTVHLGSAGDEATIGYNSAADRVDIDANANGTPEFVILSSGNVGIGTTTPEAKLEVVGNLSGSRLIISGNANISGALLTVGNITTRGTLSGYNLTVSRSASISGTLIVKTGITSKGSLSGSTFYGAGLGDCTGATQKLLYNPSTGKFTCGTITAAGTFSTGNVLTIGDARYVRKSGDTMTGTLVVQATMSGRHLIVSQTASISGALVVRGVMSGRNLTLASSASISGTLIVKTGITSKGSLSGTTFYGAGLGDCTGATQKLLYNPSTGKFVCGTISASSSFSTGNVLTIGDARYVRKSGDTMTGTLVVQATMSGRHLIVSQTASISGALVVRGVMSGRNLTLASSASISGTLIVKNNVTTLGTLIARYGLQFMSGALMNELSGFNSAINLPTANLATRGVTRLTSNGNLQNIGSIQAGETLLSAGGTFAAKVDYTTGSYPWSVAIGDLNGDGKADLAVSHYTSTYISVFLNNGNGTFAAKVDYTTGSNPVSVAIGDLNGDGKADLAVTNYGSNSVSVFLNNGNGAFAARVDYTTASGPASVAIGDVNGDGKADLAVANASSTSTSVFLNNGNGTFAAKVDYTTGTAPYSVAIGDVNGDGKADLAVSNFNSTSVSVFLNNGNGTFAAKVDYTTGTSPYSVAIGDLNGDGKADLAVSNNNSTSVSVFLNNGNGTFAAKVDYTTGTYPSSVAIGDVNGDGNADLAVANHNSDSVSVFLNKGNGTFAAKVDYTTGTNPRGVAIGDMNGDGKADLAVANYGTTSLSVLLNNANTILYAAAGTGGVVGIGTPNPGAKLSVSGAVIISKRGNLANAVPDAGITLEVAGTISGSSLKLMNDLSLSGGLISLGNISTRGTLSGTTITGFSLGSCNGSNQKLLYNYSTQKFECGVDQTASSGMSYADARDIFVNQSGDTMTGILKITKQGGYYTGALLNVLGGMSGRSLYVTGSGAGTAPLIYANAGNGYVGIGTNNPQMSLDVQKATDSQLRVYSTNASASAFFTLRNPAQIWQMSVDGADSNRFKLRDGSANVFLSATDQGTTADFAFNTNHLVVLNTGYVGIGTTTPRAKLEVSGSISGSTLFAQTFSGAGLVDCDLSSSKLLWDATTEKFSCGTDQTASSGLAYGTAEGIFVNQGGDTMTGTLTIQNLVANRTGLKLVGSGSYTIAAFSGGSIIHTARGNPRLIGTYDTSGFAYGVTVAGRYAYVTDISSGLKIIDVSNPVSPTLIGAYNSGGNPYEVAVVGRYAYVADSTLGLQIIDISNPVSPMLVGTYNAGGDAYSVTIAGSYAYVANGTSGLRIIDVSNPASPTLVGTYNTSGLAIGVVVAGRYAYVADYDAGLQIIDISNPASPTLVGTYNTSGNAASVVVAGRYAYVADYDAGLQIIDISNPASPTLVGTYNTSGNAWDVAIAGRNAYVSDELLGIKIVDISNPAAPTLIGAYDTNGSAFGIAVAGRYAYLGDYDAGLQVFDLNGFETPTATIGALETYSLNVRESARVNANLVVDGGLNVGAGLHVIGNASIRSFSGTALTLSSSGSNKSAAPILNVIGTASGSHLHGEQMLSSSGALVWEGTASGKALRVMADSYFMGKLGVGIASPTYDIDVVKANSPGIRLQDTTNSVTLLGYAQNSDAHIGTYSNHKLYIDANSANAMVIDESQRVGIGETSPFYKLQLNGALGFTMPGGSYRAAITPTRFGYSASYKALMFGTGATNYVPNDGAVTLAFNYDPRINPNGGFTGNGREVIFRSGVTFVTPDSDDNGWFGTMTMTGGRVGIGTQTPKTALDVVGAVRAGWTAGTQTVIGSAGTDYGSVGFNFDPLAAGGYTYNIGDYSSRLEFSAGGFKFKTAPVGTAGASITYSDAMTVLQNGSVGIGTTSPGFKLEVVGSAKVDTLAVGTTQQGQLTYGGGVANTFNVIGIASKNLSFGSNGVYDRMFMDTSGNVGIGTTSPRANLEVAGTMSGRNLTLSNSASISGALLVRSTIWSKAALSGARLIIGGNANVSGALLVKGVMSGRNLTLSNSASISGALLVRSTIWSKAALSGARLIIGGNANISGALLVKGRITSRGFFTGSLVHAERDLTSSGTILVSQSTIRGSGALTVNQKTNSTGAYIRTTATGAPLLALDSTHVFKRHLSPDIIFGYRGTFDLSMQRITGATLGLSGSLVVDRTLAVQVYGAASATTVCRTSTGMLAACSSSLRYKEDVLDLDMGLDTIRSMRAVNFKWKDRDERDFGFIAEEMEAINPLLVEYDNQGQVQGVKYMQLTAVLTNAIQALDIRTLGITNDSGTVLRARDLITTSGSLVINSAATGGTIDLIRISSNVGGTGNTVFRVNASGAVFSDSSFNSFGADYAEWFYSETKDLKPGDVVCIDILRNNAVKRCERGADPNVMGIISTNPAFIGNTIRGADGMKDTKNYVLVGLIGQVPAKVDLSGGPIRPGDSLTPAVTPGYARRAAAGESTVGVALEGYAGAGHNVINVLISRRNQSLTVETVEQKVLDSITSMNIGDEVSRLVQAASENLDVDARVTSAITSQLQTLDLTEKISEAVAHRLSGATLTAANLTPEQIGLIASALQGLNAPVKTDTGALAALENRIVALETSLMSPVYHYAAAEFGTLKVSGTSSFGSGITVVGTSTIGPVRITGTGMTIGSLVSSGSLTVMGPITIHGLAEFLGDVHIKGELVLSNRQAGFASIPKTGTSVTVHWDPSMTGTPVVTATPDVPVLYAVSKVSATGFTIRIAGTAEEHITFSYIALSSENPEIITGAGQAHAAAPIPFPVNEFGQPVSHDPVWNGCIQGHPLLDGDGHPLSCARYHEDSTWQHPDLGISFTYNPNHEPPILVIPEGYVITPTGPAPGEPEPPAPIEPEPPAPGDDEMTTEQDAAEVSPSADSPESSSVEADTAPEETTVTETPPQTESADPAPPPTEGE